MIWPGTRLIHEVCHRYTSPQGTPMAIGVDTAKHLEFVQAVIARQASNSFLIKGWAITVSGAIYGFAINGLSWPLALLGLVPAIMFWGLDAYFLRQERLFRCLYNSARKGELTGDPYTMDTEQYARQVPRWICTAFTRTLWPFFSTIVVVGVLAAIAVGVTHHSPP